MSEQYSADINLEVKGTDQIERAVQNIIELETNLKAAADQAQRLSSSMGSSMGNVSSSAGQAAASAREAGTATRQMGEDMQQTAARGEQSWGRFQDSLSNTRYALYDVAAMWGTVKVAALATTAVTTGVAASYEKSFSSVARTTLAQGDALATLRDDLVQLSRELPVAFSDIAEVATIAAQLGVANDDIAQFTQTVTMFAASTGMTVDAVSMSLGRLAQLTGTVGSEYEQLASAIYQTGITAVATEAEILAVSEQIATSGDMAGLANHEIIALGSALASLGVRPEAARGSFQRIFQTIEQGAADGGVQLERLANISGMSASEFQKAWGSEPQQVLSAFINGLGDMQAAGENTTNALLQLGINSVRDRRALQILANNTEVYAQSLRETSQAYQEGSALQDGYAIGTDTLIDGFTRLKNNLLALVQEGGGFNDLLKDGINVLNGLLEVVSSFTNSGAGKFALQVAGALGIMVAAFAALQVATALARGSLAAFITAQIGIKRAGAPMTLTLRGITKEFYALATGGEVALNRLRTTGSALSTASAGTSKLATGLKGAGKFIAGIGRSFAPVAIGTTALWGLGKAAEFVERQTESAAEGIERVLGSSAGLAEAIIADTEAAENGGEYYRKIAVEATKATQSNVDYADAMKLVDGSQRLAGGAVEEVSEKVSEQTRYIGENTKEWLANTLSTNETFREVWAEHGDLLKTAGFDLDTYFQKLASGEGQQYVQKFLDQQYKIQDALFLEQDQAVADYASLDYITEQLNLNRLVIESLTDIKKQTQDTDGEMVQFAASSEITAAAMGSLGDETQNTVNDVSDLGAEIVTLSQNISDYLDIATGTADVAQAFYDIGEAIAANGTSFDMLTQNGIANTEALKGTITTLADSAGEDSELFVGYVANLLQGLQDQGVNVTGELGWVLDLLNNVSGNEYGINFSTLPARQNIAQFIADLIAAEQAVVNAQRQMAQESAAHLSMFPGFQNQVFQAEVDTSRLDALLRIQQQIQNVSDQTVDPVQQIARGYGDAARGAGNTAANTDKAKKSANGLRKELRTSWDYASDLNGVFDDINDTIFGMTKAKRKIRETFEGILDDLIRDSGQVQLDLFAFDRRQSKDDMAQMFNDLRQSAKDAAKEVRDSTQALREAQAQASTLSAEKGVLDYQLMIAKALGNNERIALLEAQISEKKAEQAKNAADIADAEERRKNAIAATSTTTTGTSDVAIGNRAKLRDLAKGYMEYADQLRDAGVSEKTIQKYVSQSVKDFTAQAKALGFTGDQIKDYVEGIEEMSLSNVKVNTSLKNQADNLDSLYDAYVDSIVQYAKAGASQKDLERYTANATAKFKEQARQMGLSNKDIQKYTQGFKNLDLAIGAVPSKVDIKTSVQNPSAAALTKFFRDWNNKQIALKGVVNDTSAKNWRTKNTGGRGVSKNINLPISTKVDMRGQNYAAEKIRRYTNYLNAARLYQDALNPYNPRLAPQRQSAMTRAFNAWRNYYDGGFTGRGGRKEEAGIVHRGEYVFRKDQVDQSTGMPKPEVLLSMLGSDFMTNGHQLPSTPATSNTKITNVFSPDGILLVELLPTQMQQIARMVATAPTAPSFDASSVAHAVNQINEIQTNRGNG